MAAIFRIGVGVQGVDRDRDTLLWMDFDAILFLSGDLDELVALRQMGWKGQAWVRFYDSDTMAQPASARVAEHIEILRRYEGMGITDIIPANELNAEVEHPSGNPWGDDGWHSRDGYGAIGRWLLDYYKDFRIYDPQRRYKLHFPGLAPGGNPSDMEPEGEYSLLWNVLRLYDAHDIHVYGPLDDEWRGSLRLKRIIAAMEKQAPGKPRYITEVNAVPYIPLLDFAKARGILGCFWFLFRGNPEHAAFDLGANNNLDELRNYIIANRKEEPPMPPTPVNLYEMFPEVFAQWQRDGGDPQGDFRRFLMATGRLPARVDDYIELCEHLKSAAEEIKQVGLRHF